MLLLPANSENNANELGIPDKTITKSCSHLFARIGVIRGQKIVSNVAGFRFPTVWL
jgi:hypothetical protein